ncbi:hypothetical protein J132_11172 [Termitomyces sp. J132]|nr:hypothetical protein J132_11172 [Termitomyces sp. J132]
MPSTLKRLVRPLIRRKRGFQPVQNVLGPRGYDSQYHSSINNLLELDAASLEPPTTSIEAPIHRLPVEVLGLIFIRTLDPLRDRRRRGPQVDSSPIVLCGVLFNAYCRGSKNDMALYRLWLERTRGAPLVINFDKFYHDREFDAALNLFFSHSSHWADVTIILQPLTYAKLLRLRPEDVPLLKRVHILGEELRFTKDDANKIISTLAQIPTLSNLTWSFEIPENIFSLTWPNLRRFSTGMCLQTAECLALLSCFPRIEDIVFDTYVHSPIDVVSSAVTVKSLRSLSIRSCDDPAELFDALTLPSLNALLLPKPENFSSPECLINRSGCILRHLGFSRTGVFSLHILTQAYFYARFDG